MLKGSIPKAVNEVLAEDRDARPSNCLLMVPS